MAGLLYSIKDENNFQWLLLCVAGTDYYYYCCINVLVNYFFSAESYF